MTVEVEAQNSQDNVLETEKTGRTDFCRLGQHSFCLCVPGTDSQLIRLPLRAFPMRRFPHASAKDSFKPTNMLRQLPNSWLENGLETSSSQPF